MPGQHVDELFSAAVDDALTPLDAERFHSHMERCTQCADAYEEMRISVAALKAMPHARMPIPVHVPSAAPAPESASLLSRRRGLRWQRVLPGGATAIAAVAAAAILVIATRGTPSNQTHISAGSALAPTNSGAATTAGCASPLTTGALASAPAGFQHSVRASDPGRPGQSLVLSSQSGTAAPGSQVVVFAQLVVPRAGAAAPGAAQEAPSAGVLPCVTVSGASAPVPAPQPAAVDQHGAAVAGPDALKGQPPSGLESFTIPPGTARGTVLHVVATIPAGFPDAGQPPLTVDLQITVQ